MDRVNISVDSCKSKCKIGDLFGVFFEDINHAADGGLYAELVRNRSFEFDKMDNPEYDHLTAYRAVGKNTKISIEDDEPFTEHNPHYAKITVNDMYGGIANEGFDNIPVKAQAHYVLSVRARKEHGSSGNIYAQVEKKTGEILSRVSFEISEEWNEYVFEMTPSESCDDAELSVMSKEDGTFYLDYLSLFPTETFNKRPNGLRTDIATLIADLKPKFVRFPGGCLVHDGSLKQTDRNALYYWKNSVGSLPDRESRRNNWGYNQTLGLGYFEYFSFCEDIGAKPLPVLAAGYNPHSHKAVPMNEMDPIVEDALDLIEFANGSEDTKWGKIRAELGHFAPFGLEYIAIGNEELGHEFVERFPLFRNAIKEKYPEIKVISSVGPFADGADFDEMWKEADKAGADLVDEHYYMSTDWFLKNVHRYDSYKRTGAKVFLGEYASWGNKLENAVCEAAYMTALENNADKVGLACYAPLLCHVKYKNWTPDMIFFDGTKTLKTANYHVQKLFMNVCNGDVIESSVTGGKKKTRKIKDIEGFFAFEDNNEQLQVSNFTLDGKKMFDTVVLSVNGEVLDSSSDIFAQDFLENGKKRVFKSSCKAGSESVVEFSFIKKKGDRQVPFIFGIADGIYYRWEIGGWANDMSSLARFSDGKYENLTFGHFVRIEEGKEYKLKLEINGRRIRAYINDELYHDYEERETVVEPLYVSATKDEDETMHIKVVNVNENAVIANIQDVSGDFIEVAGWDIISGKKDDENTFDEQNKVQIEKKNIFTSSGSIIAQIPAWSVSRFDVKKNNNKRV